MRARPRAAFARLRQTRNLITSLGLRPRIGIAPRKKALKARISVSIPDVSLVKIKPMCAQQLAVFLLECASAMVFLLRVNVLQHGLKLTRAHREHAVTARSILRSPLPLMRGED